MADVCDQSENAIDLNLRQGMSRIKVPAPGVGDGPCEECGEPVGEARGLLGYLTCIDCAYAIENERRLFAEAGHGAR